MRKISLEDVRNKFDELLYEEGSREDISSWAFEMQMAEDTNDLIYVPQNDECVIWDCIQFLTGIDLKDSPDEYLHNREDVENFKNMFLK